MPICQNCNEQFPNVIKIGNVWKTLNKRKYCLDCSPYNLHNTKRLNSAIKPGTKKCSKCEEIKELKEFYRDGKHTYCIPCAKKDSLRRKNELKTFAIEYKGGKCQVCGYDKCMDALEFHHTDRSTKLFNISHRRIPMEELKKELDKCELLCCRCHREKEAELRVLTIKQHTS